MNERRLPATYFAGMYARDPDPWGFTTRWYEQRKRALTMAALPKSRYHNGFEPRCSIGTLTEQLATRCERLVCTDIADQALDLARARLAAAPDSTSSTVEFRRWGLGDDWAEDRFDLIVFSEICYYLD